MENPETRHSFVQLNSSFVHLVQYGPHESLLKFPTSNKPSQQSSSFPPHAQNISASFSSSSASSLATTTSSSFSTKSANITTSTQSISSSFAPLDQPSQQHHNQRSVLQTAGGPVSSTFITTAQSPSSTSAAAAAGANKPHRRLLIVFIPGNPGILGMYHDFLQLLCRPLTGLCKSREQAVIMAISHNNHDHPDEVRYKANERFCLDESDLNFAERAQAKNYLHEPHHIELQVLNKLIILKRMLKVDYDTCRMIFIGHSIGCYIILRLLQDKLLAKCHMGSIMLHPAFENLALTPKGSVVNTLFGYKIDYLVRTIGLLMETLLPRSTKERLAHWLFPDVSAYSTWIVIDSLIQVAFRRSLKATIQMAKSEFAHVKDINPDLMIRPHLEKLRVIYAIGDHWVNESFPMRLKQMYPSLYLEEQRAMHAFTMESDTQLNYVMKVANFIYDMADA